MQTGNDGRITEERESEVKNFENNSCEDNNNLNNNSEQNNNNENHTSDNNNSNNEKGKQLDANIVSDNVNDFSQNLSRKPMTRS